MSIEWLGLKDVSIDRLKLDGDWRKRLAEPRVAKRAASIEQVGCVHPPVVRKSDMKLLAGRDRVAAMVHLGHDTVTVRMVECDNEEAKQIATAENVERRHLMPKDLQDEVAQQLDDLTKKIAKETGLRERGPGQKGSARRRAIEQLAQEHGVTPEAIERQQQRRRARQQAASWPADGPKDSVNAGPPPAEPEPETPVIETFGIPLDAEWLNGVALHQDALDKALGHLAQVATLLTTIANSLPHHPARLQDVRARLGTLREALKGSRPVALCPWCKGQENALKGCAACQGTCLALEHQLKSCPPELLEKEPLVFYDHGAVATLQTEEEVEW